jgi:hypothetical protein
LEEIRSGLYFLNPTQFDFRKIDNNFKELLRNDGLSDADIDEVMHEINSESLTIDTREMLKEKGVFYKPEYAKYLSQKPYDDMTNFIRSVTKDIVMQGRFGKNNTVLSNLLEEAQVAGEITEDEKYMMASVLSDFIAMNKGKYKPIKNKALSTLQDSLLFFGTITYMDFNFFANMAEMANGLVGLQPKQMWTYMKTGVSVFTKQFLNDIRRGVVRVAGGKDRTKRDLAKGDSKGAKPFKRGIVTGTIAPKGSISAIEGVDVNNPQLKNFLNHFWNWNQVENQTNAIRAARGALAWDNISKYIFLVASERNGVITRGSREARDQLQYYGLDPTEMVDLFNKMTAAGILDSDSLHSDILVNALEDTLLNDEVTVIPGLTQEETNNLKRYYQTGIVRFTDELVVRPEPGSTPKIIEDPRFALFTQFKRFISHFTANVIPRVWTAYIRSGKPAMTRQTFTVILSAYAMAMLSQAIKDAIVYGEEAPWLEDDEEDPDWLRTSYYRAAAYTGWGGTPSMALEFINEYSRNSAYKNPLDNVISTIAGESPVLNTIQDKLVSNKTLGEKSARLTPFFGDIKQSREFISNVIDNLTGN